MQAEQLEEVRRLAREAKEAAEGARRRYRLSLAKLIGILLWPFLGAAMLCLTSFGGTFWDYLLAWLAVETACFGGCWGALLGGETKL